MLTRAEPVPDEIHAALVSAGARLGIFSRGVRWYGIISSTNDVASHLAAEAAAEGTVVAANTQTAGRGRLGRQWSSPPEAGLYVSVVLRPPQHAVPMLTIAAGVAISEGIEAATGLRTLVKWPNDIYVGPRKLAGILAEAGTAGSGIEHAVVGFGINLMPAAYPPDVGARATSIESELGRAADRGLVLAECLASLDRRYRDLCEKHGGIVAAWRGRAAATFGRRIEWDASGGPRHGIVEDLDDHGALIVRCGGERVRLIAGEVRWIT